VVRASLLVAVAVICLFAVLHFNDLTAAVMGVAGMGDPLASPTSRPLTTPKSPASPSPVQADVPQGQPFRVPVAGTAAGTCISYPSTNGPATQTVFVDAGHGGPDPGVIGTANGRALAEKDVTLAVAMTLAPLLRGSGYRVVLSRTRDSAVASGEPSPGDGLTPDDIRRDLLARISCANAAGATLLVAIHFNGLEDPGVAGSEAFYDAVRPFAQDNQRLARDLQHAITSAIGSQDLGVWPDDENVGPALSAEGSVYGHLIELGPPSPGYVDQPSQMPGALVEPLFLSNPNDAQEAADPATQHRIAEALANGIHGYFNGA
jgi:N-acetylmuramoyl-L-alanine amidase